nr:hypothetical protein [Tanacetum cinerariifolium]
MSLTSYQSKPSQHFSSVNRFALDNEFEPLFEYHPGQGTAVKHRNAWRHAVPVWERPGNGNATETPPKRYLSVSIIFETFPIRFLAVSAFSRSFQAVNRNLMSFFYSQGLESGNPRVLDFLETPTVAGKWKPNIINWDKTKKKGATSSSVRSRSSIAGAPVLIDQLVDKWKRRLFSSRKESSRDVSIWE